MDIFEVIENRRSIRRYAEKPVEHEKILRILDAARLAPSWINMQCWRFLVLTNPERRALLLDAFPDGNPGKIAIATAPVTMVVCAGPSESGKENGIEYYIADTAIAFEHFCLAAHALGLGTCWMGWYDEDSLKRALDLPPHIRVLGITPLGYPDQTPKARPRKRLSDIVFFNEWNNRI
jgi:nitroreductase